MRRVAVGLLLLMLWLLVAWLLPVGDSPTRAVPAAMPDGRLVVVDGVASDGLHALAMLTGAGVTVASALLGLPGRRRRR